MKAIILSAGRGSRLLPLNEHRPKCLPPLDEQRSIIEWQIASLEACGVNEIVVVVGFGAADVEAVLAHAHRPTTRVRTLYNPFFDVADNLGSCWLARHEMDRDFVILNG